MEEMRLEALRSYRILDTAAHPCFDAVTEAASRALDMPIALVTFIDEHRQWFKSAVGLSLRETPRAHAFCNHTIQGDRPLIVEDARADARFADNPLVTGKPGIRFYAGIPLIDHEGFALGALCVIDTRPRTLDDDAVAVLEALGDCVMTALTAHHQGHLLKQAARKIDACPACEAPAI